MTNFSINDIVVTKGYKQNLNKQIDLTYKVCEVKLVGKHELIVEELQPRDYYSPLFKVRKTNCVLVKASDEDSKYDHDIEDPTPGDLVGVIKDDYSKRGSMSVGMLIEIIQKTDLTSKMGVVRIGDKEKVFHYKNLILVE